MQGRRGAGAVGAAPEVARLRGENRLLKADLQALQRQEQIRAARENAVSIEPGPPAAMPSAGVAMGPGGRARAAAALARHHSTTAVEGLQRQQQSDGAAEEGSSSAGGSVRGSQPLEPTQQRWIHRLWELEKRLKAEREARVLDRNGARKRLEEERNENQELKMALEREKERQKGQ